MCNRMEVLEGVSGARENIRIRTENKKFVIYHWLCQQIDIGLTNPH